MAEEREPFPSEDPRELGESNQNTESNPQETTPGGRRHTDDAPAADAPDDRDGPPGQATGNRRAAG